MAIEIRVPTLGESVTEATVGKWFKKAGDAVKADEPLVELETDKVTVEVPAPASGVLGEIKVAEGQTVAVGALLGAISNGAAAAAARPRQPQLPSRAKPAAPKAAPLAAASRNGRDAAEPGGAQDARRGRPRRRGRGRLRQARPGSEGGRRRAAKPKAPEADAGAAVPRRSSAAAPSPARGLAPMPVPVQQLRVPSAPNDAAREERVRMTRLRQTIARRLKDAQNTAAMLTTFNDVDMSAVMKLRNQYKDLFEKRHGVKLGFMGFFVKACIQALKEIPAVNAEIDGDDIIYKNYYHIGVAVGTENGLVVPVVREADRMSLAEIETQIADFGKRARDGKLVASRTCRAARSPSPTAASTARCCRRRSSTRRSRASSACTASRSAPWCATARSWRGR